MPFDCIGRYIQMLRDFLVGPAPGGQHGHGKFGGGQIIRYVVPSDWIMNSTPSGRETIGDVDDPLKILRPFWLNGRLQHGAQQAVMFPEDGPQPGPAV